MKCKICENYFIKETKFFNLFVFDEICDTCKSTFDISPKLEVFPTNGSLIDYYYLYSDISINTKQLNYLEKYYKNIYDVCLKQLNTSILIVIDKYTFINLENDLYLLEKFGKLVFVSLERYNFEEFMFFY